MSSFSTLSSLSSSSSDHEEEARASSYSCNQTQRRSYKAKLPGLEPPRLGLAELLYNETFACKDPERSHFLDACFLCKKSLGRNRDIFMYRGDTPFCSEECRQEQIERDEAEERIHQQSLRMKSSAMKQSKKNQEKGSSATPPKSQPNNIRWRAGTVSVAG